VVSSGIRDQNYVKQNKKKLQGNVLEILKVVGVLEIPKIFFKRD
jgi:hypothetical protein